MSTDTGLQASVGAVASTRVVEVSWRVRSGGYVRITGLLIVHGIVILVSLMLLLFFSFLEEKWHIEGFTNESPLSTNDSCYTPSTAPHRTNRFLRAETCDYALPPPERFFSCLPLILFVVGFSLGLFVLVLTLSLLVIRTSRVLARCRLVFRLLVLTFACFVRVSSRCARD